MGQKNIRLQSRDDLMSFANSLLERSVRDALEEMGMAMDEEEGKQQAQAAAAPPQATPPAQPPGTVPGNPMAKQHPVEDLENPTVEMAVDKLNSIRSGRSFRDSSVKGAMEQYFEKLSKEEKSALFAFLKGISQIVTGEVQGQNAIDPDDSPAPGIKMTKTGAETGKKVKNVTVIRPQKKAAAPAAEDTAAPAPIRPRTK